MMASISFSPAARSDTFAGSKKRAPSCSTSGAARITSHSAAEMPYRFSMRRRGLDTSASGRPVLSAT